MIYDTINNNVGFSFLIQYTKLVKCFLIYYKYIVTLRDKAWVEKILYITF